MVNNKKDEQSESKIKYYTSIFVLTTSLIALFSSLISAYSTNQNKSVSTNYKEVLYKFLDSGSTQNTYARIEADLESISISSKELKKECGDKWQIIQIEEKQESALKRIRELKVKLDTIQKIEDTLSNKK